MRIAQSHSDFLSATRVVATGSVMFNHLMHFGLVELNLPSMGRASIPLFLMIAGYFGMMSVSRATCCPLILIFKKYYGLWFVLVPGVVITTAFGIAGYSINPDVYSEKFVLISSPTQFFLETLKTLTFTGEFWVGYGAQGFAGNEALWTIFYILPFTAILAVAVLMRGVAKHLTLAGLLLACGPFMLMLSPLYFAGALAYWIHQKT